MPPLPLGLAPRKARRQAQRAEVFRQKRLTAGGRAPVLEIPRGSCPAVLEDVIRVLRVLNPEMGAACPFEPMAAVKGDGAFVL